MLGFIRKASLQARPSAPPAVDPQAAIAALLAIGGEAWTLDDSADGMLGVINTLDLGYTGNSPVLGAGGLVGGAMYCEDFDAAGDGFQCSGAHADSLLSTVFNGGDWWVSVYTKANLTASGKTADPIQFNTDDSAPFAIAFIRTGATTNLVVSTSDAPGTNSVSKTINVTALAGFLQVDVWFKAATRTLSVGVNAGAEQTGVLAGVTSLDYTGATGAIMSGGSVPSGSSGDNVFVDEILICTGNPTQAMRDWRWNGGAGRSNSVFAPPPGDGV